MREDRRYGAIAAANVFFGVVNFLIVSLPPGWRLVASNIPPEVDRMVAVGGVRWAVEGRARNGVVAEKYGARLDVEVRGGNRLREWERTITVNGHRGFYRVRRELRGLFRRREVEVLEINFYCDATNRTVRVRFEGPDLSRHIGKLVEYFKHSVCH